MSRLLWHLCQGFATTGLGHSGLDHLLGSRPALEAESRDPRKEAPGADVSWCPMRGWVTDLTIIPLVPEPLGAPESLFYFSQFGVRFCVTFNHNRCHLHMLQPTGLHETRIVFLVGFY